MVNFSLSWGIFGDFLLLVFLFCMMSNHAFAKLFCLVKKQKSPQICVTKDKKHLKFVLQKTKTSLMNDYFLDNPVVFFVTNDTFRKSSYSAHCMNRAHESELKRCSKRSLFSIKKVPFSIKKVPFKHKKKEVKSYRKLLTSLFCDSF